MGYPSGTFASDPASDLTHSPYHGPNASSIGEGPSYDWGEGRWLPVPRALVSPDGTSYAYEELVYPPVGPTPQTGPPAPTGSRIHVVTVATAADHIVLDTRTFWSAVAYSGRQVYLIHACIECASGDGELWTLDVSSGRLQPIVVPAPAGASPYRWTVVGPDAAWSTDSQGGLARLDFVSKTVSAWFSVPGKSLRPIGLDAQGHPLVEGEADYAVPGSTRGGAWLVTAPQQAVQMAPDSEMINDALADDHGIWLLSFQTIDLRTPDGLLTQVAPVPGQGDRLLAGPCQ